MNNSQEKEAALVKECYVKPTMQVYEIEVENAVLADTSLRIGVSYDADEVLPHYSDDGDTWTI